MFRPRVIPVLLLKRNALIKTINFKKEKYLGDPINIVRLFNELLVDELVLLDVEASINKTVISKDIVRAIGEEANMPFAVGGGITSLEEIKELIAAGAEKVIINSYAIENLDFIHKASSTFGSSTIVVCVDIKKVGLFKKYKVFTQRGKHNTGLDPIDYAKSVAKMGAGEIIVQSIDRDGKMDGYDIGLIKSISEVVDIPVVALGGAGTYSDLIKAYREGYATGLAAGSLFVYYNKQNRGVLINYPNVLKLKF